MRTLQLSKHVRGSGSAMLVAGASLALSAGPARADITYTDLFTLGKGFFAGISTGGYQIAAGGKVIGSADETITEVSTGPSHALVWSATSPNGVDLRPNSGYVTSYAYGTNGTQQVGRASGTATNGNLHAILWSGTAASYVDLHPTHLNSMFGSSSASATSGTQQVGIGFTAGILGFTSHALLWTGTAASCVDLTPNSYEARAHAVANGQQVGYATVDIPVGVDGNTRTEAHAMRWSGTAASAVDLNPAGFTLTIADGTDGQRQVGSGSGPATNDKVHALFWSGTAASAVDLHPPVGSGFEHSTAKGVNDQYQVGGAKGAGLSPYHAMLWSGTAASYVDLHALLPATFTRSMAYSISGNTVYGTAVDGSGNTHAIAWNIVPEPAALSLLALGGGVLLRRRRAE